MTAPTVVTVAGREAALKWNRTIHGTTGDRHAWVLEAIEAIELGLEPPRFPSRNRGVHEDRVDTLRRLLSGAVR